MLKRWADPNDRLNSPEYSQIRSQVLKNIWEDKEGYKAFHEAQRLFHENGGAFGHIWRNIENYNMPIGYGIKGIFISAKSGKSMRYQSRWELHLLKLLEDDIDVVSFQSQPFSIEYLRGDTGRIHRYTPDVLVEFRDGSKTLIEVKPYYQVETELNQSKFKSALQYCNENGLNWQVMTELDLFS